MIVLRLLKCLKLSKLQSMRHKEFEGMLFYPVIRLCQLAGMEDFELADSGLTPG